MLALTRLAESAPLPPSVEDQKAQLELIAAQEAITSARADRIWTAVSGMVAIAGLVVSIVALRRGRL